jgi:stage V sporulation protein G
MEENMQKIAEIQIVPVKASNGLVAFASFVYDQNFYFGSIGIYTRPEGGYRLTYPTRKAGTGNFNIFHPINRNIASEIENAVISKYEDVTNMYVRHSSINTK